MAVGVRRFATLTALAAAVAVSLVSTGSAGLRTTAAPTVYVTYSMNCTFAIVDDSGKTVTSIAPGAYQVDVRTPIIFGTLPFPPGAPASDMTACKGVPQFQLTGPGVNLFTTLSAGCVSDQIFLETFQPNATYVAQDLNQPTVARGSFTTVASGTPVAPVVTYGGGKGKSETSTDIVGSLAFAGTLNATVGRDGAPVLKNGGKSVSTLKSGRYKFTISDLDPKLGFNLLGPKAKAPQPLSSVKFVGKRSVAVKLTDGRWTYYTSLGAIKFFRVTG